MGDPSLSPFSLSPLSACSYFFFFMFRCTNSFLFLPFFLPFYRNGRPSRPSSGCGGRSAVNDSSSRKISRTAGLTRQSASPAVPAASLPTSRPTPLLPRPFSRVARSPPPPLLLSFSSTAGCLPLPLPRTRPTLLPPLTTPPPASFRAGQEVLEYSHRVTTRRTAAAVVAVVIRRRRSSSRPVPPCWATATATGMVTRPPRTAVPTPATHRCRWKKRRTGRGDGRACVSAYMSVCARVMVRPMRKTAERMRASAWMVTYWRVCRPRKCRCCL